MDCINISEALSPPLIENFLNACLWAIHEAAFVLTEWPKEKLYLTSISYSSESNRQNLEVDRSFFYLPECSRIDPQLYGKKFEEVYNDLKSAVENGTLECKIHRICGVLYLVVPSEVITWALLRGYILPDELQDAIGIRQETSEWKLQAKTRNTLPMIVKEMILAQFLLAKDPKISRGKLYKEVREYFDAAENIKSLEILLENADTSNEKNAREYFDAIEKMKLCSHSDRKVQSSVSKNTSLGDLTAIRQHLKQLYDSPGKQGRPKGNKNEVDGYVPKAIQEVVNKDPEGNFYYNFPLFQIAMRLAVKLKIDSLGFLEASKMGKSNFGKAFLEDEVVRLYLQNNEYVFKIIARCIDEAWSDVTLFESMVGISNMAFNNDKFISPRASVKQIV